MAQKNEDIRIIIRNQSYDDQEVYFSCNSYVLEMKQKIKQVHTAKPDVTKQKIIYHGKILKDSEVLKDVFKETKSDEDKANDEGPAKFIVHIVIAPSKTTLKKEKAKTAAKTVLPGSELRRRINAANSSTTSAQQPSTSTSTSTTTLPNQWFNPQLATTEGMTPQELYNQQYQQYLAAYQQYYAYYTGLNVQNLNQSNANVANQTANQNAPNRQQNAQNVNHNQPPVVAADGNGGQAAVALDNEGHDWLDYCYMVLRVCFVIILVVMYSSLQRIVVIGGLALVVYLYQRGFFNIQRRIPARPQQPIRRQQNNEDNNPDENTDNETNPTEGDSPPEVPPPSRLATLWCFVTTFFTSLLPNPNNPPPQAAR